MKEIKTNSKNINKSRSSSRFGKNNYNKNQKIVKNNFRTSEASNTNIEVEAVVDTADIFQRTQVWNSISGRQEALEAIRDYRLAKLNLDDLKVSQTVKIDITEETSKTLKSLAEKKLKLKFNIESSLRQEKFYKRHIKRSITNIFPALTRRYYKLPKPKVYKNKSKGICYHQPKFVRFKNQAVRETLLNNLYRARLRLHINDSIESNPFIYDDNFQGLLDFFYKTDLFVLEGIKKSKILDPVNVIIEFKELARNAVFAVKGLNEMTVNSSAVSYGLKSDNGLKNISYFKTYKNFLNLRDVRFDNRSTQTFNVFTPETSDEFKILSKYKKELSSFSRVALKGKKLGLKVRAYTLLRCMDAALNNKNHFVEYPYRNLVKFYNRTSGRNVGIGKRCERRIFKYKIKKLLRVKSLISHYITNGTYKNAPTFTKRKGRYKKYINKPRTLKKRLIHEKKIKKSAQSSTFKSIKGIKRLKLKDFINVLKISEDTSLNKNIGKLKVKLDSLVKVQLNAGHVWARKPIEEREYAFEIFKYSKVNKSSSKVDLSLIKSATSLDFIASKADARYISVAGRKLFGNKLAKFSIKLSCSRRGKFNKMRNAFLRKQGTTILYKKKRKSRKYLSNRSALKQMSIALSKTFNVSQNLSGKRRNIQQAVLPRKAVLFQKLLYRRLALEKLAENGLIDAINSGDDSNVVINDFLKSDKLLQTISRSNLKLFFKRYARIFFYVADPFLNQIVTKIVEELPALSLCCAVVKNHKELLSYREDSNLKNSRNMVFFFGKEPSKDVYRTNLRSKFYLMHLVNSYSKLTANGPDKIFTYRTTVDLATIGKITALFTLLDQVIVNEVFPLLNVIHDKDEEFDLDNLEESIKSDIEACKEEESIIKNENLDENNF